MGNTTQQLVDEAAANGAAWMDENYPDWVTDINLETFSISNTCYCVLGQTTPGYHSDEVADMLCPPGAKDSEYDSAFVDHGFTAPIEGEYVHAPQRATYYQLLQEAWIKLITDRKEAARPI